MAERSLGRVSAVALVLLVGAAVLGTSRTVESLLVIAVLAAAVAVGHLLRVPAPSGGHLHLGLAAAAATPLLVADSEAVAAVLAIGLAVTWGVGRLWQGQQWVTGALLVTQTAGFAAFAATFFALRSSLASGAMPTDYVKLAAIGGAAIAWFVTTAVLRALIGHEREQLAFHYLWLLALSDWPVMLSLFATGALAGFAWDVMGLWTLPLALMPYGFSHVAFVRTQGTRITYRQTIQALARIPEVAGLTEGGHAARTADLAVAIAKDLGLTPAEVTELEFAALMHDVGRITLNEPAVLKAGYSDQDVARWGAEIISEAPYLRRVSHYVAQQHQPYRRPGEARDESLPMASKIIRAASAYDQAVSETGLPPLEAIEVLHAGAAYDFDPAVVGSLRRVASRRGAIAY